MCTFIKKVYISIFFCLKILQILYFKYYNSIIGKCIQYFLKTVEKANRLCYNN